jgi:hypothetical protein
MDVYDIAHVLGVTVAKVRLLLKEREIIGAKSKRGKWWAHQDAVKDYQRTLRYRQS